MLVKCKICKTEYNFSGPELTSLGMEFKCSECGHIWIELPDQVSNIQDSTVEHSENQIVEPSVLSGKIHEAVNSDILKNLSISDLAKQELLVQKGIEQTSAINANAEKLDDGSKDRKFEWIVSETGKSMDKPYRKAKSFETLTKPSDSHHESIKHEITENLTHHATNLPTSISGNNEEIINPELVERIKGVEKTQSNENDKVEEPLTERIRSSKTSIIIIISGFIFATLYTASVMPNLIIEFFPFLEPVISFISEKTGLLLKYLSDFL